MAVVESLNETEAVNNLMVHIGTIDETVIQRANGKSRGRTEIYAEKHYEGIVRRGKRGRWGTH